ncbi:hypothetical protein FQA47_015701 [Oryzias melastigma]|uniref:Uncharacterized protein n=1 Tax=Oryzias melastigma TaxID=30732 RepID=A0A834CGI7_ORYME|nr:hypothetical protein FQA47_015701 [Oryzias melastigma]
MCPAAGGDCSNKQPLKVRRLSRLNLNERKPRRPARRLLWLSISGRPGKESGEAESGGGSISGHPQWLDKQKRAAENRWTAADGSGVPLSALCLLRWFCASLSVLDSGGDVWSFRRVTVA